MDGDEACDGCDHGTGKDISNADKVTFSPCSWTYTRPAENVKQRPSRLASESLSAKSVRDGHT